MKKRELTSTEEPDAAAKRTCVSRAFVPIKVATAEAAAAVDSNPPFLQLQEVMKKKKKPQQGESVVYWMRMADLRVRDNRALSRASEHAKRQGVPLIAIFILSPQDYVAHDRSACRIDFTLRNLAALKKSFAGLHIPFHVTLLSRRGMIPSSVLSFCKKYGARSLFANIEYEVDELRRDLELCKLAGSKGVHISLFHNKCLIEPGVIVTKQKKAYAVYSPYQKNWIATLNDNLVHYLEECPEVSPNNKTCKLSEKLAPLFDTPIPEHLDGFELETNNKRKMREVWPEGEDTAVKILEAFLNTKARPSQLGATNPLAGGAEKSDKRSRVLEYDQDRDRMDRDTTSRLSVYLSSGVISVRECVRLTLQTFDMKKVDGSRQSGIGRWIQEIAWRDFYTNIVASFPRVSMGRPFVEKYSKVIWENHEVPQESGVEQGKDAAAVNRWKEGRTGVPIVDAAMRCINEMGWIHNRARMISAMYLTKDLMIDWRVGERYFMEKLIDGDLALNNGGWQWCSSTGVDPAPYFRIFNPYSQSEKADPTGEFIHRWVPELSSLKGKELHNPPPSAAKALGYPQPIIAHNEARQRALRRYGNPGTK